MSCVKHNQTYIFGRVFTVHKINMNKFRHKYVHIYIMYSENIYKRLLLDLQCFIWHVTTYIDVLSPMTGKSVL